MDETLKRIEDKLDKLDDKLDSVDKTLAGQAVELKEHIRRTDLLENQMKPIQKHVDHIQGALKLIGYASLIAGLLLTILKLFGKA